MNPALGLPQEESKSGMLLQPDPTMEFSEESVDQKVYTLCEEQPRKNLGWFFLLASSPEKKLQTSSETNGLL